MVSIALHGHGLHCYDTVIHVICPVIVSTDE